MTPPVERGIQTMMIRRYDTASLARAFQTAIPFPHVAIDDFLEEELCRSVAAALPSFEEAKNLGRHFVALNEQGKVQITDASKFNPAVADLNRALADPDFLRDLSEITGIDNLLADPELAGGGIHMTGPRGRLDVHIDFNYIEDRKLHRRLNLLLYLNERWEPDWGGAVELWDAKVTHRHHAFSPIFNRCVIFETSDRSFHGVEPVRCPPSVTRNSFAVYYYTREAPPHYRGVNHSTVFVARPQERWRRYVLMPAQRIKNAARRLRGRAGSVRRRVKGQLKRLLARQ